MLVDSGKNLAIDWLKKKLATKVVASFSMLIECNVVGRDGLEPSTNGL
ncbi:hypothetical protein RCH10_004041 [Variovorax sp. GrIS 2.14]